MPGRLTSSLLSTLLLCAGSLPAVDGLLFSGLAGPLLEREEPAVEGLPALALAVCGRMRPGWMSIATISPATEFTLLSVGNYTIYFLDDDGGAAKKRPRGEGYNLVK